MRLKHYPALIAAPILLFMLAHPLNVSAQQAQAAKLMVAPKTKAAATPASTVSTVASAAAKKATAPPKVEFLRDIAPILDRGGCSSAGCHGKFGGRGGFQLSLMTLSPEDDYDPIVTGSRGRRIDFSNPANSLLLLKATSEVSHAGGQRFAVGSPYYNTILNWIKQGAPFDDKDPRLVTLKVVPDKTVFKKTGQTQQIRVIAAYTDGSKRDVTAQSVFLSSNTAVLSVTDKGVVSATRWGGGAVLARYLGTIAPGFFTLPQSRKEPYPSVPTNNIIDKLVVDNLRRLNIVPSPLCTDSEFIRRVTLDTVGRLPDPSETRAFVSDADPQKRAKTIDALLAKPEFADFRTLRLSDQLLANPS